MLTILELHGVEPVEDLVEHWRPRGGPGSPLAMRTCTACPGQRSGYCGPAQRTAVAISIPVF